MVVSDSRCVRGRRVRYDWFGEPIRRGEDESVELAVARWFANRSANAYLADGRLEPRRFDKYRMQTEAYVEEALERASAGRLLPGTEVVALARARHEDCPMYEFRWHRDARQLRGGRKELIRHYDAEPWSKPDAVYGLGMHMKDVSGADDGLINEEQNRQIDAAIALCRRHGRNGWSSGALCGGSQ